MGLLMAPHGGFIMDPVIQIATTDSSNDIHNRRFAGK